MSVHWGGKGPGHVNRLPRGVGGFSPATLFSAGEPGAWYDPSDFSTLFQDSAGTTPVTAVAQQVGLMLDKSQGLVLGPELVTNGDFSGGVTSWTGVNATLSGSSGTCVITADGAGQARASQVISTVAGRWYEARATLSRGTGVVNVDLLIVGITSSASVSTTTPTDVVVRFLAAASTTTIRAGSSGTATAGTTYIVDNVSVKLLPGNHAFQSNSGQRPTLGRNPTTGRLNLLTFTEQFDNAAWTKTNATVTANVADAPDGTTTADKVAEDATTALHFVRQNPTVTAVAHTLSFYAKAAERTVVWATLDGASNTRWFDLSAVTTGGSTGNSGSSTITAVGNGWFRCTYTYTFVGTTSACFIGPALNSATLNYAGTAGSGVYIWGAQLQTGTIATSYQRVVSSFDVTEAGKPDLYYVNFDGTDDGMLTNTITPGIDKAQVFTGVRKLSDAITGSLVELSTSFNNTGSLGVVAPASNNAATYQFVSTGTLQAAPLASGFAAPITNVLAGTADIAGDSAILRVNGTQAASSTANQGTGNYLAYPLYVGRRAGTSLPFNGNVYSMIVRFGANLTADQIAATEAWVNGKTGAY